MPSNRLAVARVETGPFAVATGSARFVSSAVVDQVRRRGRRPAGSAIPVTGFDPLSAGAVEDPYRAYRKLRADGPVHYSTRRNIWVISGYDEVRAALRADDVLSSAENVTRFRSTLPMMLTMDRPEHTRLRGLVSGEFSRGGLARWQAVIDELCADMIGGMVRRGHADVVTELAVPLPMELIVRILGIPPADRDRFRRWSNQMVNAFNVQLRPGEMPIMFGAVSGLVKLHRYLDGLLALRRREPGDDLLSRLLAATGEDRLDDEELFWLAVLLVVAGNETTTNLLGPLVRNLARYPEQYQLLRSHPELIPAAIEEQLRLDPPIQGLYRSALRDYDTGGGRVIPEGGRALVLYAAANRDPAHYPEPDEFRIERNPGDHLAFGSGIHYCLGAYLSKMEARRALAELVTRVSRIELAGQHRWSRNPALRGLTSLPVRFVPA